MTKPQIGITAYQEALHLDNFLQQLTPYERMQVHQYRKGRVNQVPKKVQELQEWAEEHQFNASEFRYTQDRSLLYYNEDLEQWRLVNKKSISELIKK